jgi:hypothetical protein
LPVFGGSVADAFTCGSFMRVDGEWEGHGRVPVQGEAWRETRSEGAMARETEVGSASQLVPGLVGGAGRHAVGNANARIPGLDADYRLLTRALPPGQGELAERDPTLFVR